MEVYCIISSFPAVPLCINTTILSNLEREHVENLIGLLSFLPVFSTTLQILTLRFSILFPLQGWVSKQDYLESITVVFDKYMSH